MSDDTVQNLDKPSTAVPITVGVHVGELIDTLQWDVFRQDIDHNGAPVFDGHGTLSITVNGEPIVRIVLKENMDRKAGIGVYLHPAPKVLEALAFFDLEEAELTAPRRPRT